MQSPIDPRHDDYAPDEPDYMCTGLPDAELMAAWIAEALAAQPAVLSALAQRAISAFEAAPGGSAEEATLALLSDALHDALERADEPARSEAAEDRAGRGGW